MFKWLGRAAARIGVLKIASKFIAVPIEIVQATETIQPILNGNVIRALETEWAKALGSSDICCSLSLGTPNYYRKITALIFDESGKPIGFAKVAGTKQAKSLVSNEGAALKKMNMLRCQSLAMPSLLGQGETETASWVLQSPLLTGRPSPNDLRNEHLAFLSEIARKSVQMNTLSRYGNLQYMKRLFTGTPLPIKTEFQSESAFVEKLGSEMNALTVENNDKPLPFTVAHGDFAPWNMRLIDGKLALFDWEYYTPLAPYGWDLFYFVFRVENLIKRQSLEQIWSNFEAGAYRKKIAVFEQMAGLKIPDHKLLAMIVLLAIAFDLPAKRIAR